NASACSLYFLLSVTDPTALATLSLHAALPISRRTRTVRRARAGPARPSRRASSTPRPRPRGGRARSSRSRGRGGPTPRARAAWRSEEHTSELQSLRHLVCRLLLEKKKRSKQAA